MDNKEILAQFTAQLEINRNLLEDEWSKQPGLYAEVGEWASSLRREAKAAKSRAESVYSELLLDVHQHEDHCGLPKTTEAIVKAYVLTHEQYTEALDYYHIADKNANDAGRLLEAFEQRKAALRDLVRLYVHEYYMSGDPQGPSPEERGRRQTPEKAEEPIMEHRRRKRQEVISGQLQDREDSELEENTGG